MPFKIAEKCYRLINSRLELGHSISIEMKVDKYRKKVDKHRNETSAAVARKSRRLA